ncbi:hypothetical protein EOM39_06525 [Candidatus Gracilibacteria bacterium]|nr:hypothetical protein [Candidatus Gracilibacteria bacterium]
MSDLNTSNANGEEVEKKNAPNNEDLSYYKELSQRCARRKISGDNNGNSVKNMAFYNDFTVNKKYNQDDFFNDFKKDLNENDLRKILVLTDAQKKEYFENYFSIEVSRIGLVYEKKKEQLSKIIESRYTISERGKTKILGQLASLDYDTLDKMSISVEELDSFIKEKINSDVSRSDDYKKIALLFENFTFSSSQEFVKIIEEKVNKNPELGSTSEVISSLRTIFNKIKTGEKIDSIDIKDIISYGIFNDEQRKQLLKIYLPTISLQELFQLKIIDENEAKKIKKEELTSFVKKKRNIDLIDEENDEEFKTYIQKIDFKDIYISSAKYINSNISELEKSDSFNEIVAKSFNYTTTEIKEKIEGEIQTIGLLKKKIIQNPKLLNIFKGGKEDLEKLNNGVIFKFNLAKEENSLFYEVSDFSDNGKFKWKNRSIDGKYNSSSEVKDDEGTYKKLLDLLSADKLSEVELITKEELKSKIESGNITELSDELGEPSVKELNRYKDEIKSKIEKYKEGKKEDDLKKDNEYKRLLDIQSRLDKEDPINDILIKEELNLLLLSTKIDQLDPDGRDYGIKLGTSFKMIDGKDEEKEFGIYTISYIDSIGKTLEIQNRLGEKESKITFDQFYKGFKNYNGKLYRFTNNLDTNGLVDSVSKKTELSDTWSKFEIKNNSIMKKGQDEVTYPFLVQDNKKVGKSNKLLKIHDVVGTGANQKIGISNGEVGQEEYKEKDDKGKEVTKTKDMYNVDKTIYYVTPAFLENYIKENDLKPKTLENEKQEKDKIKPVENPKWGFAKWFFSNKSMHEIMKGLKMGFTEFQNHLKGGSEEHAAKVALATWGRFIPSAEIKAELLARVETAEKKHMEEYIQRLEAMDSWQAVKLIDNRLGYSNTEEYKKEAGLMFMLKKYGNLYNKPPLNAKKGSFMWFKALTKNRGDITTHPVYIEVKAECQKEKRNFTEEELVWKLMKKQCSKDGYGGIHRRSRLHKEVEKEKKAGVMAEYDDGLKKAKETRNPEEQLKKGINEFLDGSPGNGVGRLEGLIDRGTSMLNYNKIPFMLVCSGNGKTYSDTLSNKIKGLIDSKRPVLLARYMSYPADMDLAKETIRVLSHKIHEYNPKLYPNIGSDIEELYKITNSTDAKITEEKKLKECKEFYEKINPATGKSYGDILTRAMYNLADGRKDLGDDVNVVLLINKDKPGKDNKVLKDFYNTLLAYSDSNDFSDKDYMTDSFKQVGVSSLGPNVAQTLLEQHSGGGYRIQKGAGTFFSQEIVNEIVAIRKRTYSSKEAQKIHLDNYLKMIFKGLILAHTTDPKRVYPLFTDPGDLAVLNNNWGVNYKEIVEAGLSVEKIDRGEGNYIFDKFVGNIIDDKGGKMSAKDDVFSILEMK